MNTFDATTNENHNDNLNLFRIRIGKNEVLQSRVVLTRDGSSQTPPFPVSDVSVLIAGQRVEEVKNSWIDQFKYKAENQSSGSGGLRSPQLGALHAILAHWSVKPELPATIVMPTGTGKTETMLALLINQCLPRILVVVPNNALRDQVADKFLTLGILRPAGLVTERALNPFVGKVRHRFESPEEAEKFLSACNVIVATMQAISACDWEVRNKISDLCSHLIIDEAHHVSAPSWNSFRHHFEGKPILQFTATPFRNDGKHVGGKLIYSYPLGKAQQENYFKPINFRPVYSHTDPDRAIAKAAIDQLVSDRAEDFDHIVMARVDDIKNADTVCKIYREIAPDLNPLVIHSKLPGKVQRDALREVKARSSRVIVCVDMLGEGFDLPQLKIAAMHDVHKSLAITLQFIGRFTRVTSKSKVGDATVIVNRANIDVNKKLKALYAEDADWNQVIRDLGQDAVGDEENRSEFMHDFASLPKEVAIQAIEPKMSAVAYRTGHGEWNPNGIFKVFNEEKLYTKTLAISEKRKVVWFVTREPIEVRWGGARDIEDVIQPNVRLFLGLRRD